MGSRQLRACSRGRWIGSVLAAATLIGCQGGEPGATADPMPPMTADTASSYAAQVMWGLGGQEAWDQSRYISFRWLVERGGEVVADREHSWDRYDGHYRVSFEQRDSTHLMLFNLNELRDVPQLGRVPNGRAWIGPRELEGAARDTALRRGYSVFVNDSYWALMPFKWDDPGVHLTYEGMRTLSDGERYAVIHLAFDPGLGVTDDQYWAFVEPTTGEMAAWQYHLGRDTEPGDVIWWTDWERVGTVNFAMNRVRDGERFIYFEDVVVSETVPAGRFDPPTP